MLLRAAVSLCISLSLVTAWLPMADIISSSSNPTSFFRDTSPLQYITPGVVAQVTSEGLQKTLLSTILPVDQSDAVAIFISEGISGFLGGAAVKAVSILDGNKNNKDSGLTNAQISASYFGVAGALRTLISLSGVSDILVSLLALAFAGGVSELIKIRTRSIQPLMKKVGDGPAMYDLMKFKNPSMVDLMRFANQEQNRIKEPVQTQVTQTEIYADLTKWAIIYAAIPSAATLPRLEDSVFIGAVAGVVSQAVREQKDREQENSRIAKQMLKPQSISKPMTKTRGDLFKRWKERRAQPDQSKMEREMKMEMRMETKRETKKIVKKMETKMEQNSNSNSNSNSESKSEGILKNLGFRFTKESSSSSSSSSSSRSSSSSSSRSRSSSSSDSDSDSKDKSVASSSQAPSSLLGTILQGFRKDISASRLQKDLVVTRFARAAVECAAQLLTYEAARGYVMEVGPYFQQSQIDIILKQWDIPSTLLSTSALLHVWP